MANPEWDNYNPDYQPTVQDILEDLDNQIAAVRASRETKGMHVPYHGPFCSAVPSVLKDLERLSASLREALRNKSYDDVDFSD